MGAWGTAIMSCDMAQDVADICKEIYGIFDLETAQQRVLSEFAEVISQEWVDNELASFWYALANWQWKHGVLTDEVKEKTLSLLESYAGLEEWEDNPKDAAKRRDVLDRLRAQLLEPQGPVKLTKLRPKKPRHRPGDILIFRALPKEQDECDALWHHYNLLPPYMFRSPILAETPYRNVQCIDSRNKYMAILCVGSEKEPTSRFSEELMDENSLYAWYDYVDGHVPTVEELSHCGFLPEIYMGYSDFNRRIFNEVKWVYRFSLAFAPRIGTDCITQLHKCHCPAESQRFERLLTAKGYSDDSTGFFSILEAYGMTEERDRMALVGFPIDNLLDVGVCNPELLIPEETNASYRHFILKTLKEETAQ